MNNLNDIEAIRNIDPENTLATTDGLVQQCKAAWEQVGMLNIPSDFGNIKNIVFCGMGASIYGALVTKSLSGPDFKYPSEIVTDYHLPAYVNDQTLVVLTSYSGTTEEVLSCAKEAKEKEAKMLILTKGGPLADFAKQNNVPAYIFDGKLNLSSTPRLGAGYTILGLMGLLNKARIIYVEEKDMIGAIDNLNTAFEDIKQKALQDSALFVDRIPVIFAAEHMAGNAQILRNQFNETSKTFSSFYLVPDLNHHLMEGLQFPKQSKLYFIIMNSKNYSEKISRRMKLTMDIVKQNNQDVYAFEAMGMTLYEDFLEVLAFGSYLTLYLGLRNDQNPATNPWVDYFKKNLG